VIVTHGATGAFICAVTTLFNPGDEVILFEPFYGYHKSILELNNIAVKAVSLNLEDLSFNPDDIINAIGPRTKGIILCTPNNPTGKVYSKEELLAIGQIAKDHNLWVITDEIYEYITYPGHEHISFASLEDFKERTLTISGFSKTYNMTGWRLGYVSGPAFVLAKMALVQDLLYVCPARPLQHAAVTALQMQPSYYNNMKESYLDKSKLMTTALNELGFKVASPQGAYYLLVDFSAFGFSDDEQAAQVLLEKALVATVPGRYFYVNPEDGKQMVRFCYALDKEILLKALKQIESVVQ